MFCKVTHVSILMLACTLSTARPLSQRHAHAYEDCEHTARVLKCNCYIHGPSFYICTTANTPGAGKIMFLYAWVMSSFAMSHVSIYVVYTWIHVSKYINHVLLRLQQRVHRVQARVVLCIYTCGMFLLTIRSVSIYAYVSEYARCKHGSSSYVPESCHMYMTYT